MEIKLIGNDISVAEYNKCAAHPLQSWEWGEARKEMGISVLRIGKFAKGTLKEAYQLTFHPIPLTKFTVGYLPRSLWPSTQIISCLLEQGKKHNAVFIKIEPYVKESDFLLPENNPQLQIVKSRHPLFPEWTQMIDLGRNENEILSGMHPKTRYNIRLAQKKGVTVREMSDEKGFAIFSDLYFETCARQRYFGHTPEYHKIVWKHMKKSLAHILVAFYDTTPLAAYELFCLNKSLYYPYGGTSLSYRNFMGANLLMWESVKLGKKLGASTFDMWGSLSPGYENSHPWSGFTRFKQGYGTDFVHMAGSYDLVIHPLHYSFYTIAHAARTLYLQLKKSV